MISIGYLDKEKAAEMGITMKSRKNGEAGVMVWLEFKKEGVLENFTYAELRLEDSDGEHLLSAKLRVSPVFHEQPEEITSVAFSVDPLQLENCSFMVVAYNGIRGGVGYVLKVSDFLDLPEE